MKTLIITLVTIVVGLVALPDKAEAAHCSSSYTYRSGYASCGCATYTRRVFNGYDCHGHAIYRYYRVPVSHHCRSHYRPVHRVHHSRHHSRHHTPHHNLHHIIRHFSHHGRHH